MSCIISKILKNHSSINSLALLIILIYLVMAFFIVKDYGITWDEPRNFGIGEKYLYFYHTGHLDFEDDKPVIKGHPNFYDRKVKERPYMLWPFANILSAITCYIFYQKINLFDPISAHHIIIPILTAIFLYILFLFVKRHWGNFIGLISILTLITYPRFFGHSFNNIKDVPETIFFSITIMLFAEWVLSHRMKYLYSAFICFGFALATKMDAILIPIILILWQIPFFYKYIVAGSLIKTIKTLFHIIAGLVVTSVVVLSFYPPLFPWQQDKASFLISICWYICTIGINPNTSWNLYAPVQIFYITPVVILVLFIYSLVWIFIRVHRNNLHLLLIIWVLFPILRHCLPYTNHYGGIRHFLVSIVPFAIIVSIGFDHLLNVCSKLIKIKKGLLATFICMLFLIPNLYSLISLHPYQTTYFNSLIGGLKGAQEKEFPYSSDYWLNSYRKAGEWLDKNAKNNSYYCAIPYDKIFKYYILRKDLKSVSYEEILSDVPPNTYIVVIPKKWWFRMKYESKTDEILTLISKSEIVYRIERQGGEIITIYYNP